MMLDVYVQDHKVGVLDQTGITSYVFSYLPSTPKEHAVSLLMPPRTKSWSSSFLFPVFQVSLPEGALRQTLEQTFAKNFDQFGDMELLAIVGENLIGQIKVVPHGIAPSARSMQQTLESLLSSDLKTIVKHYLGVESQGPGVSGGFLKFLARSPTTEDGTKRTLAVDQWVVKLNDPDRNDIVLLEHFGMTAAREMGLDVPDTHLSPDFSRLLVKRFDVGDNGVMKGFEDMCALTAQPARDKFSGSVERIVKIIRAFCPGAERQRSTERFYAQYLLAATIRNGDAHLKNFGLLYEPGGVPTLSPVYDMLTMAAYAPQGNDGDANDAMALTLGGTKRWPDAKALTMLAHICDITPLRQRYWQDRLASALLKTSAAVLAFQQQHRTAGFCKSATRMLELWGHGMRAVDGDVASTLMTRAEQVSTLHD